MTTTAAMSTATTVTVATGVTGEETVLPTEHGGVRRRAPSDSHPRVLLAHQWLRASAPADGETLDRVPEEIRLTFSERVRLDFTSVEVVGPEGPLVLAPLRTATDDERVLVAPVEGGWHPGDFTLRWSTVGADGHRTDGTLSFVVEEDADGLPEPEPEAPDIDDPDDVEAAPPPVHHDPRVFPETPEFGAESPAYAAIRGLLFVALLALLGAVTLRWAVLPAAAQRAAGQVGPLTGPVGLGAARLGLAAAAALFVAALARLWAQTASIFGPGEALNPERLAAALSFQPWGTGWWLQAGAALVATVGFALVLQGIRAGWAVAVLAALTAAATPALSGHAVASPGLAWLAVPADALHVIAAGGWVGGLLALVVIGLPATLRLEPGRRGSAAAALVQGFSPVALVLAGILMVTGVFAAWIHLGDVTALWTSAYGRTLLLKLAIFSGVFLVGAYNFLRVRPALGDEAGPRRLRRSATVELILALLVIAVTAVLVAIPPPAD
jgi:putative copper export protein/methionine-rich copper-binding protein CopC